MPAKIIDKKLLFLEKIKTDENISFKFFQDDMKDTYVIYQEGGIFEIRNIKSEDFISYITGLYIESIGGITTKDTIKTIIDSMPHFLGLKGKLPKIPLATRVGMANNKFYYDFCNDGWDICEIDEMGWRVRKQDFPLFRRNNGQNEQCFPEDENCFEEIFNLVNISEKDQILFAVTLVSYFIPEIAHPILMFSGRPGVSKTTTHTIVKSLIDPTVVMGQSLPKDGKDLLIQWKSQYVLFYDNISSLSSSISDILCRGVTGEGASNRKLYTDSDEVYTNLRRCFLINGISQPGTKPDLMQRTVLVELEPITKEQRKTEKEIFDNFNKLKPKIIGSIFNIITRAMSFKNTIKLENTPRLADFAIWGEAISRAIGFPENAFLDSLLERQDKQETETADFDPLFTALTSLLSSDELGSIEGTSTFIFNKIKENVTYGDLKYLPHSPGGLGGKLKSMKDIYEKNGIIIETRILSGVKKYKISFNKTSEL